MWYSVVYGRAVQARYDTTAAEVYEACKSVSAVRLISGMDYRLISKDRPAHQKEGDSREFGGPKANDDRGGEILIYYYYCYYYYYFFGAKTTTGKKGNGKGAAVDILIGVIAYIASQTHTYTIHIIIIRDVCPGESGLILKRCRLGR